MTQWWYLTAGVPTGPLLDGELVAAALNGRVSPASSVYRDGAGDWAPLERYEQELGLVRNSWSTYFVAAPPRAPERGGVLTELGRPWPRVKAYFVDYFVLNMIGYAIAFLAFPLLAGADSGGSVLVLLFGLTAFTAVVCLAYEVFLTAVRGQTVGKLRYDLEVTVAGTAEVPDFSRSLLRAIVKAFTCSGFLAPITFVVWLATPKRVTLHDWVAGTVVQEST